MCIAELSSFTSFATNSCILSFMLSIVALRSWTICLCVDRSTVFFSLWCSCWSTYCLNYVLLSVIVFCNTYKHVGNFFEIVNNLPCLSTLYLVSENSPLFYSSTYILFRYILLNFICRMLSRWMLLLLSILLTDPLCQRGHTHNGGALDGKPDGKIK